MMKIYSLIYFLILIVISKQDSISPLHGLFYDLNQTNIYYGSINVTDGQFNIVNTLNINDVGNPKLSKYPVLPLTYDPNNDVIYISAPNNENRKPILSVINATTGLLMRMFNTIEYDIVSLQYDIFQKQLFAHIETNQENLTQIVEIDTNNGNIKQILGTIQKSKPTHISSYCPICRKYFLIAIQDNHYTYIGVNSSDGGGISWQTPIHFAPISIRFDYKTFTMYSVYINQTDQIMSLVGILNRTIGPICRKYFLIAIQDNHYTYIGVNSSDGGGISWQTPIHFAPISIRFDYKTFTMYSVYINQTDQIMSLVGILNRTIGGIGEIVGTISYDSILIATQLSAFDIEQKIYYASFQADWPYSTGISTLNLNTTVQKWTFLPKSNYYSYAWFVKQFVH
ncbi:unnamed protein product [Adineta steineri]|uniref:Uncharacterized protein n=1 Tax=Adineta steineri TaxID=433720 RepID=A0A814Y0A2_9BILA|nr:unnamed protein product [Adineta steineri]